MRETSKVPITRTLDLSTARDNFVMHYYGDFVQVIRASSRAANITVQFDEPNGRTYDLYDVDGLNQAAGVKFRRIYISHDAQSGEEITIAISNGSPTIRAEG